VNFDLRFRNRNRIRCHTKFSFSSEVSLVAANCDGNHRGSFAVYLLKPKAPANWLISVQNISGLASRTRNSLIARRCRARNRAWVRVPLQTVRLPCFIQSGACARHQAHFLFDFYCRVRLPCTATPALVFMALISSPCLTITRLQVPSEYVADPVQSEFTVYGPESLTGNTSPPKLNVKERELVLCPPKENVPAAANGTKSPISSGFPWNEGLSSPSIAKP
jgi:hypothetical protein